MVKVTLFRCAVLCILTELFKVTLVSLPPQSSWGLAPGPCPSLSVAVTHALSEGERTGDSAPQMRQATPAQHLPASPRRELCPPDRPDLKPQPGLQKPPPQTTTQGLSKCRAGCCLLSMAAPPLRGSELPRSPAEPALPQDPAPPVHRAWTAGCWARAASSQPHRLRPIPSLCRCRKPQRGGLALCPRASLSPTVPAGFPKSYLLGQGRRCLKKGGRQCWQRRAKTGASGFDHHFKTN